MVRRVTHDRDLAKEFGLTYAPRRECALMRWRRRYFRFAAFYFAAGVALGGALGMLLGALSVRGLP